jgi:ssDNA-binding Zn-finger/Zn-ribbon topoisomerase 1
MAVLKPANPCPECGRELEVFLVWDSVWWSSCAYGPCRNNVEGIGDSPEEAIIDMENKLEAEGGEL